MRSLLWLWGVSVYYARRALFPPRRRLSYALESASPLVDQSGLQSGSMTIEVLVNGVPLADPHLAVVRLKNSGRHAIASEQFDQQRALEIDLNASVVELLSAEADQHGTVIGACAVSGATISFGPEVIKKGKRSSSPPLSKVRQRLKSVITSSTCSSSQRLQTARRWSPPQRRGSWRPLARLVERRSLLHSLACSRRASGDHGLSQVYRDHCATIVKSGTQ